MSKLYKTVVIATAIAGLLGGCANLQAAKEASDAAVGRLVYGQVKEVVPFKQYRWYDNVMRVASPEIHEASIKFPVFINADLFGANGKGVAWVGGYAPDGSGIEKGDIVAFKVIRGAMDNGVPGIFDHIAAKDKDKDRLNCKMTGLVYYFEWGVVCKNDRDNWDFHDDPGYKAR